MKLSQLRRQSTGFTLVELLIVVIILSILAAIVVPQFASSTNDAKYSALDANLGALRAATELYYQQHGAYPSGKDAGAGALAGSVAAFTNQLTLYTKADGTTSATGDTTNFKYGPYLKKGVPVEPVSGSAAVEVITTGTLGMTATGAATGGWKFDTKSGQLIANSTPLETR